MSIRSPTDFGVDYYIDHGIDQDLFPEELGKPKVYLAKDFSPEDLDWD